MVLCVLLSYLQCGFMCSVCSLQCGSVCSDVFLKCGSVCSVVFFAICCAIQGEEIED